MNRYLNWATAVVSIWASLMISAISFPAIAADGEASAHGIVEENVKVLLKRVFEEKPYYKANPERFNQAISEVLTPVVDFDRIAKQVMGKKFFKTATDSQVVRFTEVFRSSLIKAYSATFAEIEDQKIVVLPPSAEEIAKAVSTKKATVKMEIIGSTGDKIPLAYSMQQHDGEWKVTNIVINGINMGLTFRNQFAQSMSVNANDIDKVIQKWRADTLES